MSAINPSGNHELVSVVIPIYNAEGTLDECLASIEAQTHRELEVVCVNDGSTDASARIAREHAARDGRIVVVDKPNEGYGASCNRGVATARGTWVAIVEPDDVLPETAYEDLLACADAAGGSAAAFPLDDALRTLAERAAAAVGAAFCGVDVLFGKDGYLVCEVNSNAYYGAFERATGQNVAGAYAEHILCSLRGRAAQ